jgi:hypothetical protein
LLSSAALASVITSHFVSLLQEKKGYVTGNIDDDDEEEDNDEADASGGGGHEEHKGPR